LFNIEGSIIWWWTFLVEAKDRGFEGHLYFFFNRTMHCWIPIIVILSKIISMVIDNQSYEHEKSWKMKIYIVNVSETKKLLVLLISSNTERLNIPKRLRFATYSKWWPSTARHCLKRSIDCMTHWIVSWSIAAHHSMCSLIFSLIVGASWYIWFQFSS